MVSFESFDCTFMHWQHCFRRCKEGALNVSQKRFYYFHQLLICDTLWIFPSVFDVYLVLLLLFFDLKIKDVFDDSTFQDSIYFLETKSCVQILKAT